MASAAPFTPAHFDAWVKHLVLDNGERVRLEPFQRAFVEDVFSGRKVCWLVVPEGNGKTTLLAALGLYGLRFADGASIPIAASARDQARIMYRQMKGFVKRSGLEAKAGAVWFEAFDGYRQIQLRTSGATARGEVLGQIELYGSDEDTADGVIPFPFAFLDELHRHKDLRLHRTWTGKLDKRDAQLVVISTAGTPGGEFETTREGIRAAALDVFEEGAFGRYSTERVVMHEFALRAGDEPADLDAVKAANPLASITTEQLLAKRSDPTMTDRHWRRFTCNLATADDGTDPFIEPIVWGGLAKDWVEIPEGASVCLGGDGSRTWDTTVIAWAWQREDGCVAVAARVFSVREDVAHHVLHKGGRIDFDDVEAFVLDRFQVFNVAQGAYDPRYLERSMDILEVRLPPNRVVPVEPQSKAMRNALQAMFNLAAKDKLRHSGDPVLAAHLANTGTERGASNEIRRVRKIDARLPIDAVPAMALAVWQAESVAEPLVPMIAWA